MANSPTNRNPLLPAAFLLLVVFILLFFAFRLRAAIVPEPTSISLGLPSVGVTPLPITLTSTPTRTPRPTWTLRPSETPTQTPTPTQTGTPTPLPSLTPAKPLKFNDLYRLRTYNSDLANQITSQLQSFPDGRFPKPEQKQSADYNALFAYPAFAYQEALLQLPHDPSAQQWQFNLAYDLARSNDPQAGQTYASLLADALDASQTRLEVLPDWFNTFEQRMQLITTPIPIRSGQEASDLVSVVGGTSETPSGAAVLWMVKDPSGYKAQTLSSSFNFTQPVTAQVETGDLTGDSFPEVVISYSPVMSPTLITPPPIYNLATFPAAQLPVDTGLPFDVGIDFTQTWTIENGDLVFTGKAFPSCPVIFTRTYHWNGSSFSLKNQNAELQPDPNLLAYCQTTIDHSLQFWGPQISQQLMKTLEPSWPPSTDTQGNPYPADARDQFRYQLGLEYALAGEMDQAKSTLHDLANSPQASPSHWAGQAQAFLKAYQSPDDLYRACIQVELCDPRDALRQVIQRVPVSDYGQLPAYLEKYGISQRSSGIFDFENDGKPERWILVRHRPEQKLEFWILPSNPEKIQALFVDVSDSDTIKPYYHEPVSKPPIVQVAPHQGFILDRVAKTGEAYLTPVPVEFQPTTFTLDRLNAAQADLFSGKDPSQVAATLEETTKESRFNCLNYRICDRFYYVLGLAYEMSGRMQDAIDSYVNLWWNNSSSPYTVMARLKLGPRQTQTPTPTVTSQTPATITPGIGTPTQTPATEAPYLPPTEEPTAYPYPN